MRKDKDWKRHVAYEALVLLGMVALLTFICRLWPILLLVLLGILAAVVRLLFLSSAKAEVIEPLPVLPEPARIPTEKDVRELAYSVICRRITELVLSEHPQARWIWEAPNARKLMEQNEPVFILLNRAGGYRRAKVTLNNLQVVGLHYCFLELGTALEPEPLLEEAVCQEEPEELKPENYELLAFEWVEAHIVELNERCNEAIGQGRNKLLLIAEELPVRESWQDICHELFRSGLEDVSCIQEGIKINLLQ